MQKFKSNALIKKDYLKIEKSEYNNIIYNKNN